MIKHKTLLIASADRQVFFTGKPLDKNPEKMSDPSFFLRKTTVS